MLMHLLKVHDPRAALVFTRTKHRAKRLAQQLDRDNLAATALQGNMSQNKRQQALDGFRNGRFHILVATDIAARGIDVIRVSHVINYDMPSTADAYTHRIGRTGRAERSGEAFTLVTQEDAAMVRTVERLLGEPLRRVRVEGFDYSAASAGGRSEFARGPHPQQGRRGGGSNGNGAAGNGNGAAGNRPAGNASRRRRPRRRGRGSGGPRRD